MAKIIIFLMAIAVAWFIYKRASVMTPEEEYECELVMNQYRQLLRYRRLGVVTEEEYQRDKEALMKRLDEIQEKYDWLINF